MSVDSRYEGVERTRFAVEFKPVVAVTLRVAPRSARGRTTPRQSGCKTRSDPVILHLLTSVVMTCLLVEREGRSLPLAQILRRDPEPCVRGADGHEMTGPFDLMPYGSGHSVSHLLVDGSRHESIVRSLPHVDPPLDRAHVEGPVPKSSSLSRTNPSLP